MPAPVAHDAALQDLAVRVREELTGNILPFWEEHAFDDAGWMRGVVKNDLSVDDAAPRHAVIAARILRTYAAASEALPEMRDELWSTAGKAYNLLLNQFWDPVEAGVFWALNPNGSVAASHKQIYAQAFAIYSFAEWHRASGDERALAAAMRTFELIEARARDLVAGGYLEALSRSWGSLEDTALSEKDLSVPKSMNTNLHVLEAYTALLRVTRDYRVQEALHELLSAMIEHVVALEPFAHCQLFFDFTWNSHIDVVSYGHDIEASWLLWDAWEALADVGVEDPELAERARSVALLLAEAVRINGQDADGGVMSEGTPAGVVNDEKQWWPQAEGVVGWLNAYQLAGRPEDRAAALAAWDFIESHVIDREHGEWFGALNRDGSVQTGADNDLKIGPWKCPYHNARVCLEVIRRVA
jgi:mannobiose 2-epimerase